VTAASQSAPPAASCYPLSNKGTCYQPGEFCRYSDAGTIGVAGEGERIECEDNNGWRWSPSDPQARKRQHEVGGIGV